MAAPTWFGEPSYKPEAISCCVLPVAKASTLSLRVAEVRRPHLIRGRSRPAAALPLR